MLSKKTIERAKTNRKNARQEAIRFTQLSLKHHETLLEDYDKRFFLIGGCCPSCMFNPEYSRISDKIDRIEAWLKILIKKDQDATNK